MDGWMLDEWYLFRSRQMRTTTACVVRLHQRENQVCRCCSLFEWMMIRSMNPSIWRVTSFLQSIEKWKHEWMWINEWMDGWMDGWIDDCVVVTAIDLLRFNHWINNGWLMNVGIGKNRWWWSCMLASFPAVLATQLVMCSATRQRCIGFVLFDATHSASLFQSLWR